jgi:type II secretory pathway component GspD/PulD (secretin)
MCAQMRVWFLAILMVWALSHASVYGGGGDSGTEDPSPAEKIRKALEQPTFLEFGGTSLYEVAQHLKEKTRINWVVDQYTLQQMGLDSNTGNIVLKNERTVKLRSGVQRLLNAYNLTYVILEDSVLITSEEVAINRLMRQRVSLNVKNAPLATALKDLARTYAANIVLDPRVSSEADARVTLQMEDVGLETTVRLLTELANLKAVRMGTVLFVTTEARAEKMRHEEPAVAAPPAAN